jgi:hypothetical protein
MSTLEIVLTALGVAAGAFLFYQVGNAVRLYRKYRGERLITCPETQEPAAVEVAAARVAVKALAGAPRLRLRDCSRWPERENCGQDCLSQVEADPANCLVWNIVNEWYAGKNCVLCNRPFGRINWHDHPPAVVDTQRNTVQWTDVPPEKLPEVFATHWPVCWGCHIAETFRREHADLVTDRAEH